MALFGQPGEIDPETLALLQQQQSGQAPVPLPTTTYSGTPQQRPGTDIGGYFQNTDWSQPWDLNRAPQIDTSGYQDQLDFLLSGQGLDPATMAQMRARGSEQAALGGQQQMGQIGRVLGQAGLTNSPAAGAVRGQIARQVGDQQAASSRDLDIQNAQMGQQNRLQGVGLAHSLAMENANKIFQALQQNSAAGQQRYGQATNLFFGQNPVQPGVGPPQKSAVGEGLKGAAGALDQWQKPQQLGTA